MRTFIIALALVTSLAGLAFAASTPRCRLEFGPNEYENNNWRKIEAQLLEAGGCTTTTTTAAPTTTTAAPTTTTAAPTTTTAAPTTTTT